MNNCAASFHSATKARATSFLTESKLEVWPVLNVATSKSEYLVWFLSQRNVVHSYKISKGRGIAYDCNSCLTWRLWLTCVYRGSLTTVNWITCNCPSSVGLGVGQGAITFNTWHMPHALAQSTCTNQKPHMKASRAAAIRYKFQDTSQTQI